MYGDLDQGSPSTCSLHKKSRITRPTILDHFHPLPVLAFYPPQSGPEARISDETLTRSTLHLSYGFYCPFTTTHSPKMSYAEAAAKGPKQSPEEVGLMKSLSA
jgi:hypothetical protein